MASAKYRTPEYLAAYRALPLVEELATANPGNAELARMRDDVRRAAKP